FWAGRPDILVEVREKASGRLTRIVIGEVKYTNRMDYAITGLYELIDYMMLVKDRTGKYISGSIDREARGTVDVQGMLFVDQIDIVQPTMEQVRVFSLKNLNLDLLEI